ncbi:isoleucyl-tRNA synthetase [Parabacteroides sp. PF5-5]|uniref:isoleucine--tRNA ligase n=1 Tax=unclassified Parabacteroides TaxID=2649774 RepID=UPI00247703D6|nr:MULTISPECIES: isoleucine--tRNA ligase [unclassified Parabacteroides]MDH6303839.1 isoleucyl-tRNA synthetase [Parabacteroides sp. PH5-39]MDH6314456.1 isoleucyl-tRNA synthetase [Parabacteroides sp. PF5-13]MDH6318479.1 isoleucyl-tRNA synthetase [Parabacteroides sp. PH5-13]MDH6322228.1 isoleucyl-tRNA synthetase [Parabacteroides sp. PH5-8]MDH6325692.1 isoleucyl-tRNA synthetase [Parabacteroides sp. PH5-41]
MNKKFAEYSKFNLSDINKEMLKKWQEGDFFRKSLEIREGAPSFVFYEGPPSANGMPGIHHVIARSIKDIFCRYKTMKGYLVNRKAGWDTHGLPVELGVEKELGITKEDIGKKISVAEYNAACRKAVMKYTKEWEDLTDKMGYWVDMEHPYITYDNRYIETLWYLLKELYKKGLLYKGYTIQPYSPAAGTGLSTHELNQPGTYRDVKDTTCTAQFKILTPKPEMTVHGDPFFLAWTTTPWTLPSNTALCVGPNITYVVVRTFNPYTGVPVTVVLAKDLVAAYFNPKAAELALSDYKQGDKLVPYEVVGEWKGADLAGIKYEQLIPWVNPGEGAFRVITGDFVTTEDGTGIVHIAPTFGADDDRVAKANGVPPLMLIDKEGNKRPMVDLTGKYYLLEDLDPEFVQKYMNAADYDPFAGRFVKNQYDPSLSDSDETLDVGLCMMLKVQNRVFRIEKHVHNYPHCWRTDKPVLYYPLDSWFIRTTAHRDRLIELNNTINWKPQSTGSGRFGKWLENLQDWNLSRSRFWGTPLPIWRTEDGDEEICIGSVEELYNEIEKSIKAGVMEQNPFKDFKVGEYTQTNYDKIDLHRPFVDDVVLVSASGKPMKRETDLIDVWFDSGAMPYAQIHYPFENKDLLDKGIVFPADFIAEGVDQTRGWFFTLHAISTMVFDSISFKTVISNGLVLDKNGNKMSKRLGNGIDPFATIEQYGSDPLRWYMITNASPWDNLKFDPEGLDEVRRKFFGTLYNTYSFFALYANVDGFDYSEADVPYNERPEIDRWILSLLNSLIKEVDTQLENYEPTRAGRAISEFVNDNLSNWYVRLNRRRFWGGGMTTDKLSAYQTLYTCLETIAKLMSPISPFYGDKLFCDLIAVTGREKAESVHLSDFPVYDESLIDQALEERMKMAQDVSSMVLALRRKVNIKVRQPLQTIMVPVMDAHQQEALEAVKALILNEVNVKDMKFVDNSAGILVKKVKPDFKKLGPRYGKIMKQLAVAIQNMNQEDILAFESAGTFTCHVEGQEAVVELADVEIISEDIPGWLVANEGSLTVALDITITEELKKEGLARELVNRIQNLRKSNGLDITDKIKIHILSSSEMDDTVQDYNDYIKNQVLAVSLKTVDILSDAVMLDFDDFTLSIRIDKV